MSRFSLHFPVGRGQQNWPSDVKKVQEALNRYGMATGLWLMVDGVFDYKTEFAIREFQRKVLMMLHPDGLVGMYGVTYDRLNASMIDNVAIALHPVDEALPKGAAGTRELSEADYQGAADKLGCEVAAIKAVAKMETGKCGVWDEKNRPAILYECHLFSRLTKRTYDQTHPDISSSTPYYHRKHIGYGKCSIQYDRLKRAYVLDKVAALKSASWGAFQLVGEYYEECGYSSVQALVADMQSSVQAHLRGFVSKILAKPRAHDGLQRKNWIEFAKAYNGGDAAALDYDTRVAQVYAEFSKK